MTRIVVSTALILGGAHAFGQSLSQLKTFEVASVKPHEGPMPQGGGKLSLSGSRLTIQSYSVLGLLMYAYDVKIYQISGAPSLDHTMYDVAAVAGEGVAPVKDEFRLMMQSLLADRFKLKVHQETKEIPLYALIVGKGGPKFKEITADEGEKPAFTFTGRNYQLTRPRATMVDLAELIRNNAGLDRPVLDKTGLSGTYRIALNFTPEYRMPRAGETDPDVIDIFAAVQGQLGLRLERQMGPVEMLIIDHVEKASGN